MTAVVEAPAKINLTLEVTGKRPDGYHDIVSIMQAVDRTDRVSVTLNTGNKDIVIVIPNHPRLPVNHRNTAFKAAKAFYAACRMVKTTPGLVITIHKQIPMQAGMAGGSADAAAVLVALNHLLQANLTTEELCQIGGTIGADVPFCILGGAAIAQGIGDQLTPISPMPDCVLVIAKPPVGVSTSMAYARLDNSNLVCRPDHQTMIKAMEAGDLATVGSLVQNAFEQALALPEVAAIQQVFQQHAALGSQMTGSGSAVYGIFPDTDSATGCMEALRPLCKEVFLCKPTAAGPQLISIEK